MPAAIVSLNPAGGMDVCCEWCLLSGGGFCDELITRPEKSYQLWCVVVCSLDISRMRRPCLAFDRSVKGKKMHPSTRNSYNLQGTSAELLIFNQQQRKEEWEWKTCDSGDGAGTGYETSKCPWSAADVILLISCGVVVLMR